MLFSALSVNIAVQPTYLYAGLSALKTEHSNALISILYGLQLITLMEF